MAFWSVSRSDAFPNWYLTGSKGTEPRVVASTSGDDPAFVTRPRHLQQDKRFDYDLYPGTSPQRRFHRNHVPYAAPHAELRVVPKPWKLNVLEGSDVTLSSAWSVFDASPGKVLGNEVTFLVGEWWCCVCVGWVGWGCGDDKGGSKWRNVWGVNVRPVVRVDCILEE